MVSTLTFDYIWWLRSRYKRHHIREGPRPRVITGLNTELILGPLQ